VSFAPTSKGQARRPVLLMAQSSKSTRLPPPTEARLNSAGTPSNPRLYLASAEKDSWIPRVIEITRSGTTVGIGYAKERRFAGMATGFIYADATPYAMVVSEPEQRELVCERAIRQPVNRHGFWVCASSRRPR